MARTEPTIYRVLKTSFINNQLHEPGALVEYYGKPGSALEHHSGPAHRDENDAADVA